MFYWCQRRVPAVGEVRANVARDKEKIATASESNFLTSSILADTAWAELVLNRHRVSLGGDTVSLTSILMVASKLTTASDMLTVDVLSDVDIANDDFETTPERYMEVTGH